jgi:hypothetical protein
MPSLFIHPEAQEVIRARQEYLDKERNLIAEIIPALQQAQQPDSVIQAYLDMVIQDDLLVLKIWEAYRLKGK